MGCSKRVRRLAAILTISLFLFAIPPANADSTAPTRAQYVERVEPICRSATLANRDVLQGVDKLVRRGELEQAGARFRRAAAALAGAVRRVARVPRPEADATRLEEWLGYGNTGRELLGRLAVVLREGKRSKVDGLANQLLRSAKRANAVVVGFNFDYCRLNPARFV